MKQQFSLSAIVNKGNPFLQIRYSNGGVWNAHKHTILEALNLAESVCKQWDIKYTAVIKTA